MISKLANWRVMLLRRLMCWSVLCLLLAPAWASRDLIVTVQIRKKCLRFDRQSQNAARRSVMDLEMSHDGSDITALQLKGQTRKIQVTHLGTMGKQQETIYLENGRPIWVKQVQAGYDAPYSGRIVRRNETNLYFEDGRLLQRDSRPTPVGGGVFTRGKFVHQTQIASPAQAHEWKNIATYWQRSVAEYQRALTAKS